MSIEAIGSSSLSGTSFGQMTGASGSRSRDPDEFAASIFERDDADGDGLLSIGETPLDEDRFSAIDADGDGFISQEELAADAESQLKNQAAMGQLAMQMQSTDVEEMVSSIFERDDADGDGLLSLGETPLDEDLFNTIDTDGDGFISQTELSADMTKNVAEGSAPPPPADGLLDTASTDESTETASAKGSSGSGSSEESEEDYDEYDLNEDGFVTIDELYQAFVQGDTSLSSLFQDGDDTGSSGSFGSSSSAVTQRLAMAAYSAMMG